VGFDHGLHHLSMPRRQDEAVPVVLLLQLFKLINVKRNCDIVSASISRFMPG
jgi:hypothetical protein